MKILAFIPIGIVVLAFGFLLGWGIGGIIIDAIEGSKRDRLWLLGGAFFMWFMWGLLYLTHYSN